MYKLLVMCMMLLAFTSCSTPTAPNPDYVISITSGNNQTGPVGTLFPVPLVVNVISRTPSGEYINGNGVSVVWVFTSSSFKDSVVYQTASNGTVGIYAIPQDVGPFTIDARIEDYAGMEILASAKFTETGTP